MNKKMPFWVTLQNPTRNLLKMPRLNWWNTNLEKQPWATIILTTIIDFCFQRMWQRLMVRSLTCLALGSAVNINLYFSISTWESIHNFIGCCRLNQIIKFNSIFQMFLEIQSRDSSSLINYFGWLSVVTAPEGCKINVFGRSRWLLT